MVATFLSAFLPRLGVLNLVVLPPVNERVIGMAVDKLIDLTDTGRHAGEIVRKHK